MGEQDRQIPTPLERLGLPGRIGYACGMLGWSILINIVSVMLIYYYVPPNNSGLVQLVPQVAVLGIFTILSLIVASGRLIDAVTDPVIAYFSDKSTHRRGRRLPFMQWAIIPSAVFCFLTFVPYTYSESESNFFWLFVVQIGFYLSLTVYMIPYTALLPELAHTPGEKIRYSALLSAGFVTGIIISSQIPMIADIIQNTFHITMRNAAMQWAIAILSVAAAICLLIPLLCINERKHCISKPATVAISTSLRQTLGNRSFLSFIITEMLYLVALIIIVSGLLYYLKVLLGLEESAGGSVMAVMVLLSLTLYPLVVKMTDRVGKKKLVLFSLAYLSILLGMIYFMGKLPFPPQVEIYGFAVLAAPPLAVLGILPYAIIAEIAEYDTVKTGQQREGMFFAVRNLAVKFGQTFGIMIFAILTLFGKDPENDFGIRVSGIFGFCLCATAYLVFRGYKERSVPPT